MHRLLGSGILGHVCRGAASRSLVEEGAQFIKPNQPYLGGLRRLSGIQSPSDSWSVIKRESVRLKFTRVSSSLHLNLSTELRCADGISDAYGVQMDLGFQQIAAASSRLRRLPRVFLLRDHPGQPSSLEGCPAMDDSYRPTLLYHKANIIATFTLGRYVLSWIKANTDLK